MKRREADAVIGSRMIDPEGMPLKRRISNRIANYVTYFCLEFGQQTANPDFVVSIEKPLNTFEFVLIGWKLVVKLFVRLDITI